MAPAIIAAVLLAFATLVPSHAFLMHPSLNARRHAIALSSNEMDYTFEKRELGIWLDKIEDRKRQLSLTPEGAMFSVCIRDW